MKDAVLVTGGDLRESANKVCWAAQYELEQKVTSCFAAQGVNLKRAFPVDEAGGHGFNSSQRMGMDIFAGIDPQANLVFAIAAWQYTHYVLPRMRSHQGPTLTVANWSGQWPGLVGLLNLNGSLVKAGVPFSTLWSETFTDEYFLSRLAEWTRHGRVTHNLSHVRDLNVRSLPKRDAELGQKLAKKLQARKVILGGYAGASSERQPPMYFPRGGGSLKGVGRAGEIVWSRAFVEKNALHADIGLGSVLELPKEENERRSRETTPQWPLVNAMFHGITRNAFMARHRANHVSIAYAPSPPEATRAVVVKAAMLEGPGIQVHICGSVPLG
jgi:hypothetical protein